MKISVLLPTHNGARFLRRAALSVLSQSYSDLELLILDDGSTDGTREIAAPLVARDPRVKYLPSEKNLGIQQTLNRGLAESTGELVARIDDDDEWRDSGKLAAQVLYLQEHPDCVLVGTATIVVDERDDELFRVSPPEKDADIRAAILKRNCFTHSTVMFRKEPVLMLGGYSESTDARHVEDYDLWLRLGAKGSFANLPSYSVRFTLRPGNISNRNKLEQLRKDVRLAWRYRGQYPGFLIALIFGILRLSAYFVFQILPAPFQLSILNAYKNSRS